jgi:hypothetical protein
MKQKLDKAALEQQEFVLLLKDQEEKSSLKIQELKRIHDTEKLNLMSGSGAS